MNAKPTIAIVTPVWNGMPFIKECVDSVLSQDFTDWELLISDNGSTDGTIDYLLTLTDKRIKVFLQPENLGIMGNLNFLFLQVSAPITQILCADDYLSSETSLCHISRYWKAAPGSLGFVTFKEQGWAAQVGSHAVALEDSIIPEVLPVGRADLWFFVCGNFIRNLSNVSLRTNIVRELGGFSEAFPAAGDFEFWVRASKNYAIGVQNQDLICVRLHTRAASNYLTMKGQVFEQLLAIYGQLIQRLSPSHDTRELQRYFNLTVCTSYYYIGLKLILHGNFQYLKTLFKANMFPAWPKLILLVSCIPVTMVNRKQRLKVKLMKYILFGSGIHERPVSKKLLMNKVG